MIKDLHSKEQFGIFNGSLLWMLIPGCKAIRNTFAVKKFLKPCRDVSAWGADTVMPNLHPRFALADVTGTAWTSWSIAIISPTNPTSQCNLHRPILAPPQLCLCLYSTGLVSRSSDIPLNGWRLPSCLGLGMSECPEYSQRQVLIHKMCDVSYGSKSGDAGQS